MSWKTSAGIIGALIVLGGTAWLVLRDRSAPPPVTFTRAAQGREYLRFMARHDTATGRVELLRPARVNTPVSPLTGPGGFYAVLDGPAGVLSAVPFSFSTEVTREIWKDDNVAFGEDTTTVNPSVVVYVPFDVKATSLRVLNSAGQSVASVDSAALAALQPPAPRASRTPSLVDRMAAAIVPRLHAAPLELELAFPHITFVTSADELSSTHRAKISAVEPYDNSIVPKLYEALSSLDPLLLGSIGSIAVVTYPNGGVATNTACGGAPVSGIEHGSTVGNEIMLNVQDTARGGALFGVSAAQLSSTLVHEAVHAFHNLVDWPWGGGENLPVDVKTHVDDVRDNLGHLFNALTDVWQQLQDTARIAHSGYGNYIGSQWQCIYASEAGAVKAGFAKPYGSKSIKEDVATYVQVLADPNVSPSSLPVCQQFSGLTNSVPRDKMLPFAKLNFLRGIGLISESDYEACVQDADPADQHGFMMGGDNYSQGLKAAALDVAADVLSQVPGSRFVVLGRSSSDEAKMQIYARPPFYSLVGFHRLDNTWGWLTQLTGRKNRRNMLTVQPSNPSGAIERVRKTQISTGGFALIVNNTQAQSKGYPFYVKMEDWMTRRVATHDLVWFRIER